ncbi:hypothetical protein BDZ91DRAFT_717116, partial [Kalaharituber pfeilii]
MTLRETRVQLDRITRDLAKVAEVVEEKEGGTVTLTEVQRAKLRAKLQLQSAAPTSTVSTFTSKQALLQAAQLRKEQFDAEMAHEEAKALEEFKKGLREAVLSSKL